MSICDLENYKQLEQHKHVLLEQFVSPQLLKVLCNYLWFRQNQQGFKPNDKRTAFVLSHEPVLDAVLDYFSIVFSQVIGAKLLPTYGFSRIYHKGADLHRHIDRPACEVSCTFPLGFSDKSDWPIYVAMEKHDEIGQGVNMQLGDMLLYKGQQLFHWREKLEKDWQAQLFLHFVYADGDNVEHQFDKRGGLLMTLERLNLIEPQQIDNELETREVEEQLTDFLNKQLFILKALHRVKKSLFPSLILIVITSFLLFFL